MKSRNIGLSRLVDEIVERVEAKKKGIPQDTDPHASHYFAPYDDMGNKRTINNAVDAGWSAVEK